MTFMLAGHEYELYKIWYHKAITLKIIGRPPCVHASLVSNTGPLAPDWLEPASS